MVSVEETEKNEEDLPKRFNFGNALASLIVLIILGGIAIYFGGKYKTADSQLEPTTTQEDLNSDFNTNKQDVLSESSQDSMPENEVTELVIEDISLGDGEEAVTGKKVTVNYKGTLLDGTQFDSSYERNTPFTFNLGEGEVIAGWDQGVSGMKVGGIRKLTIPPDLGYGEVGAGGVIPPNSTLIFEVELLNVE